MELSLIQHILWSQMDAALRTVEACVSACPDAQWEKPVGTLKFSTAVFHTLFFTDLYLAPSENLDAFKAQAFHREHRDDFQDYEEVEPRLQVNEYARAFIIAYLQHCRRKAREVIFAETEASLAGDSGFSWRKSTRAELHVYNARHIQHHAAQLSLRLRVNCGIDIPWIGRGEMLA